MAPRHHTAPSVAVGIFFCSAGFSSPPADRSRHLEHPFRVGVLVPLIGRWSTLGANAIAALQIAANQLEAGAASPVARFRVRLYIRDTKLDPVLALEAIKELDRHRVTAIIDPQSSAELAMVKAYANQHNILVISQASAVSLLVILNENVFRFYPNDRRESAVITVQMWRDGVRTLVPPRRNEAGNNGLHDSADFNFLGRQAGERRIQMILRRTLQRGNLVLTPPRPPGAEMRTRAEKKKLDERKSLLQRIQNERNFSFRSQEGSHHYEETD